MHKVDHGYDPLLMASVFALVIIGFGVLGSAVFGRAATQAQLVNANRMIWKQIAAFVVGLVLFFLIVSFRWTPLYTDETRLNKVIGWATVAGWFVLLGLLFWGHNVGGASRWYRFGPVSFQPGEFFKVLFIVYFAYRLGRSHENLMYSSIYLVKPLIALLFVDVVFLVLPDRGSLLQLSALSLLIAVVAMVKKSHIAVVTVILVAMFAGVVFISPNLMARFLSHFFPELFANGTGYQIIMSSTMVKMGGLTGAGLGKGLLGGLHWLPEQYNDYIVAVLVEDLGLAGLLSVIALYLVILWRAIDLAIQLKSPAQRYAALGLGLLIISQAVINLGVALNLFPTKGATLPFVSYGGSSMVAFMAAIAGIEWLHRYAPRVNE